jgi:hypothetical protein
MDETVEKLSFESTDFKFTAAYGKYSDQFDGADDERREVLNSAISQLHSEEISYPKFYEIIDEDIDASRPFHRSRISGSRKFAYRKNERKIDRIKRHK